MYKFLIRPFLFLFDPESVHQFVSGLLKIAIGARWQQIIFKRLYTVSSVQLEQTVFGIKFPNPVGLAAGFDKNAELAGPLSALGFGFLEIGTLTPKSQPGNEKPRLFRLPRDKALINRMGFNNHGVLKATKRLKSRDRAIVVGGNIGKNKDTPNDSAFRDYAYCLETLYDVVDYFVVNVSSPNTPGLRELQEKEPLMNLLGQLKELLDTKKFTKPLLLKIAPDLTSSQLDDIIQIVKNINIDGLIVSNTTTSRDGLETNSVEVEKMGPGGLSGKPLKKISTEMIRYLRKYLGEKIPIIGVGGIFTSQDALEKLNAGANLVQVYTGFIYEGPGIAKKINQGLLKSGWNR